jgi:hypothetical protein
VADDDDDVRGIDIEVHADAPAPPRLGPGVYRTGGRSRSNVGWIRLILKGDQYAPYAMSFGETPAACDEHAEHIVKVLNADAARPARRH